MNKKTKWGIIILVGTGIIGGGIYSQLPKKNDELAAADKVMGSNQKKGKQILNGNAKDHKTAISDRRIYDYRCTSTR